MLFFSETVKKHDFIIKYYTLTINYTNDLCDTRKAQNEIWHEWVPSIHMLKGEMKRWPTKSTRFLCGGRTPIKNSTEKELRVGLWLNQKKKFYRSWPSSSTSLYTLLMPSRDHDRLQDRVWVHCPSYARVQGYKLADRLASVALVVGIITKDYGDILKGHLRTYYF